MIAKLVNIQSPWFNVKVTYNFRFHGVELNQFSYRLGGQTLSTFIVGLVSHLPGTFGFKRQDGEHPS